MEGRGIETLMSYHCLTGAANVFIIIMTFVSSIFYYFLTLYDVAGPLVNNPDSSFERAVNKFRMMLKM